MRRVPDLVAPPLGARALSGFLDRKPDLLRPLALQLLPPPLAARDPAEHLGIDLSAARTVEDFRQVLATVLAAAARGKILPAEAAGVARRVRRQWRAMRRLARVQRRLDRKSRSSPAAAPPAPMPNARSDQVAWTRQPPSPFPLPPIGGLTYAHF